jgi:MFS family permease
LTSAAAGAEQQALYTRPFLLMGAASLFSVSAFAAYFLFPLYVTAHGGSKADIGIMMGALSLAAVLSRPWAADLVDGFGRKRSYGLGCATLAILPVFYIALFGPLDQYYAPLLVLRAVHGVAAAVCFISAFTYIADIAPASRLNEGLGMFGTTGLTGMALGPLIAELIIKGYGFRAYYIATMILAAIAFALHLFIPESYRRRRKGPDKGPGFFQVLWRKRTLSVAFLALLFGVGLSASSSFVSPFAESKHISFISAYFIAYSLAAVLTRFFGGRLADRVGERRVAPYALFLAGCGPFLLTFLGDVFVLVAAGLIFGVGHGFLYPSLNTLAVRGQSIETRGKVTGIFTGGIDAGIFAGSLVLGYVGEAAGFPGIFWSAAGALWAGLVIFLIAFRRA